MQNQIDIKVNVENGGTTQIIRTFSSIQKINNAAVPLVGDHAAAAHGLGEDSQWQKVCPARLVAQC
jgi:hypothetical protein